MATANTHKLFHGTGAHEGFIGALDIPKELKDGLDDSKRVIRKHINEGLAQWQNYSEGAALFRYSFLQQAEEKPTLRAKFRTQGSCQYRTLNDPAHKPPQEVDLDDGLFLPVSFFEKEGVQNPAIMSKGFFTLIENILLPLCEEKGWELDTSKDSCIRILLQRGAHFDIPLYAIPDKSFEELVESRKLMAFGDTDFLNELTEGVALDEQVYKKIDFDCIRLAHRKDGWWESDPRKMENWFNQQVDIHGEQLRRVCRYLKAWRDYNWPNSEECKLSSIALMQCVVTAYNELKSRVSPMRDDIALLEVVKKLPDYFADNILNPILEGMSLNDNWNDEMRSDYILQARALRQCCTRALTEDSSKTEILRNLRAKFGSRLPDDASLISFEGNISVIESYEPANVPQPYVTRSTSG